MQGDYMPQTQNSRLKEAEAISGVDLSQDSQPMTSRTVRLPTKLDRELTKKAQAWGCSVSDLLRMVIAASLLGMKKRW